MKSEESGVMRGSYTTIDTIRPVPEIYVCVDNKAYRLRAKAPLAAAMSRAETVGVIHMIFIASFSGQAISSADIEERYPGTMQHFECVEEDS